MFSAVKKGAIPMSLCRKILPVFLFGILQVLTTAGASLAAAIHPLAATAQQSGWPSRVVHIIATSPPGGSIDFLARALSEEYGKSFGQQFIVENRPGANGNIGVDLVVKA